MGAIIPLDIPPKCDVLRHRGIEYTLTYVPDTKQWRWHFAVTTTMNFANTHDSPDDAIVCAKSMINNLTGG